MSETVLQLASPAARGLLRAIVEEPLDDVPRLLLADVLEEAGEGGRAEFIRVQCELAQMDAPWCKTEARENNCEELGLTTLCDWCDLRRRERELLDREAIRWVAALGVARLRPATLAPSGHSLMGATFRRGFVASVTLTCADWCGVVCPVCSGWRSREAYCDNCHGTGRTGGHGPALVLAAPIEEVTLRDVSFPYPEPIATFIDPPAHGGLIYASEQVPRVVSRAALVWARQEAGLPALARNRQ
jgi:uncharacterized protein (TIGR02996 family)